MGFCWDRKGIKAYFQSIKIRFCGLNRKDGLHLKILYEPELVYCQVNLDNRFEGFTNVLHGGIIFGILDVIIWYTIFM